MQNLEPLFIFLTGLAVLIQAAILVALYLAVRKTSGTVEALATEVKTKALPALDTAQAMLVELRPKVSEIVANVDHSARLLRSEIERVDATVNDIVDRTRLQVIRADELVNRTLDRVEETSDMVHRSVISPIKQISGLVQGLSAGLEFFLGRKRRQPRDGVGVPQDELFI
jgi:methyl-accepting chemotaxis protein